MLAAGVFGLGGPELLIILVVVVLIFGVGRLSDVGGALGKSIREFRRSAREPDEAAQSATPELPATNNAASAAPQTGGRFCSNCGAQLSEGTKFCAQCGAPTQATVS